MEERASKKSLKDAAQLALYDPEQTYRTSHTKKPTTKVMGERANIEARERFNERDSQRKRVIIKIHPRE
jgi:hypothetical protein